jgi:hypothetical protein
MIKNYAKHLMLFVLVLGATSLSAQVTFTNMNNLLQSAGGGSSDCAVDMNGDDLDDVVRVNSNGIYIDFQQPDGTFESVHHDINIQNLPNWSICAADIDGNGHTDLLFGNGSRVSFMMANEDGTEFTEDARPEYIFSQRSTFSDIDNDGNLDAFVCHDVDLSHPYRNDGSGYLMLDQSLIQTLDAGGNYAAIWCDYDNDWDSDLYITKCRGGAPVGDPQRINLLYRNNGDGTFTEVGEATNMNDGDQSWTTVFEDFDNDGDFDSFTVNHAWANRLMENDGNGNFTDIIASSGINANDLGAWNCDAGDFNNDGWIDIFSELSDELYLNNGDGTFTPQQLNFDSGGIGDFNNDGFLDVINGSNLWINDGNDNNHVQFHLEGIVSNRDAIGARVEIYGDFGMQIREVRAGESFSPMSSLTVHFGLGQSTAIDQVIIKWPSGVTTTLENPEINTLHHVIEAECLTEPNEITYSGSLNICPGTSIELVAESGNEYTWSTGADSQSIDVSESGAYSVVIYDAEGCASISNTVYVNVITEEVPSIALDGEEVFCEGGEAYLTASEGTGYEWSNGMSDQTIVVTESGSYSVQIDALCDNVTLESDPIEITVLDGADAPVAEGVEILEGESVELTATGENLMWYDSMDATEPIAEGATFTTPVLNETTSYWVEASTIYGGGTEQGGKEDYNEGGGGLPSVGGQSFFNAWEPFTIENVTVFVPQSAGAGNRTIQLVDQNGVVLQDLVVDLMVGEQVVDLGFDVPVGNDLSLRCPEANLFRNNSGVSYPYPIGTVGELTTSNFGGSYYYYFYDWTIEKESVACASERVEVMVTIVGVESYGTVERFDVFPNPTNGLVTVQLELNEVQPMRIEISDITGKQVFTEDMKQQQRELNRTLDVSTLAPGMYHLTVYTGVEPHTVRLVIQ